MHSVRWCYLQLVLCPPRGIQKDVGHHSKCKLLYFDKASFDDQFWVSQNNSPYTSKYLFDHNRAVLLVYHWVPMEMKHHMINAWELNTFSLSVYTSNLFLIVGLNWQVEELSLFNGTVLGTLTFVALVTKFPFCSLPARWTILLCILIRIYLHCLSSEGWVINLLGYFSDKVYWCTNVTLSSLSLA